MRTKTIGAWIASVVAMVGLVIIGTALFTISQVGGIGETWRNSENTASTKGAILNQLREAKGLTALDNDFANIALRNDRATIRNIRANIENTRNLLAAYDAAGVDDVERTALRTITAVIDKYDEQLPLAEALVAEGRSSIVIDAAIRVNGKPALDGVAILDSELSESRAQRSSKIYGSVTSVIWLMKTALAVSGIILIFLVVGFFRFMQSRTERNRAQRDLSKKTAILQATMDNVEQGISFADMDLNMLAFNKRFLELLDFPADHFKPGDPFENFIRYNAERGEYGPGDIDELVAERIALAKTFEPHNFERERPDGSVLEIRGVAMPNGGGFVTTYTDITEQKRAERELIAANSDLEKQSRKLEDLAREATETRDASIAANRSKSEFLANMSHELRTPLNAVIGFSDMMQNELMGPIGNPQYLSYVKDIHDSGEHLLGLINDILDLSKIEAGEMSLNEGVVDLADILVSSLKLMKPRAESGSVDVKNITVPRSFLFHGDARKIKQIALNLLSNAVKFTPENGTVSVGVEARDDGGFSIIVKDSGIGIAPEDIEKVLKPFIQADSTLARKYEGTGLGLPLTKALIELHGGSLTLTSEQGVGTTATTHFPASRTADREDADDLSGAA